MSGPNEWNRRKTAASLSVKNTSRTSFSNVLAARNSAIASDETPAASSIGYPYDPGRDRRKCYRGAAVPDCHIERVAVAGCEQLSVTVTVRPFYRAHCVNHVSSGKIPASRNDCLASWQPAWELRSAKFLAGCKNCGTAGPMDCTVDASSATEGRVCGVDYGIDVLPVMSPTRTFTLPFRKDVVCMSHQLCVPGIEDGDTGARDTFRIPGDGSVRL